MRWIRNYCGILVGRPERENPPHIGLEGIMIIIIIIIIIIDLNMNRMPVYGLATAGTRLTTL
jgi:hypothetical protein